MKASATRAASLTGHNGFIGFDAFSNASTDDSEAASSIAANAAIDESNLPHELQMALRRVAKRDSTTKLRALSELQSAAFVAALSDDAAVDSALRVWSKLLPLLVLDGVRAVRRNAFVTHAALVAHAGRRLAPHLQAVLPAWLAALFDVAPEVAQAARAALDSVFPSDDKRNGALAFAADALVASFRRAVDDLRHTRGGAAARAAKSGGDSADAADVAEAATALALPAVQAVRVVEHAIRSLSAPQVAPQHAAAVAKWLAVLLVDDDDEHAPCALPALFRLAKQHPTLYAPLLSLVATVVVHQRAAVTPLVARIAAPALECFAAASASTPLREAVQATLALFKHFGATALGGDDKLARAVGTGLLTVLRNAGFEAPHIVYAGLQPLLTYLPPAAWVGGQPQFASRTLAALWSGVDSSTWQAGNESMLYDAYIECLPVLAAAAVSADAAPKFVVDSAAHVVAAALKPADCPLVRWHERIAVVKRVLEMKITPTATPQQLCALLAPSLDESARKAAVDVGDSPLTRSIDVLIACAELGAASAVQSAANFVAAQLVALQPASGESLAALARLLPHFGAEMPLDGVLLLARAQLLTAHRDAAVELIVEAACARRAAGGGQWIEAVVAADAIGASALGALVRRAAARSSDTGVSWRCAELDAAVSKQLASQSPLSGDAVALLAVCVQSSMLAPATIDAVAERVVGHVAARPSLLPVASVLLSSNHRTAAQCAQLIFDVWATTSDASVRTDAAAAFSASAAGRNGVSIAALVSTLHRVAAVESAPCGELVRAVLACAPDRHAACVAMLPKRTVAESDGESALAAALRVSTLAFVRQYGALGRVHGADDEGAARLVRLAPLVLLESAADAFKSTANDWLWLPGAFTGACLVVGGVQSHEVVELFVTALVAPSLTSNRSAHFSEQWLVEAVVELVRAGRSSSQAVESLALLLDGASGALSSALLLALSGAIVGELAVDLATGSASAGLVAVCAPFVAARRVESEAARLRSFTGVALKQCTTGNPCAAALAVARLLVHHFGDAELIENLNEEVVLGERWWSHSARSLAEMTECVALAFELARWHEETSALFAPDLWRSRIGKALLRASEADVGRSATERASTCVLVRALVDAHRTHDASEALDILVAGLDDDKSAIAVHEPLIDLFADVCEARRAPGADDDVVLVALAAALCEFVASSARVPPLTDAAESSARVQELFSRHAPLVVQDGDATATVMSQVSAHSVLLQGVQQFAQCYAAQDDTDILVDGDEPLVDRAELLEEQAVPTALRNALSHCNDGRGNALSALLVWSVALDLVTFHSHNGRQHAGAYLRRGDRLCALISRVFDAVDTSQAVPTSAVSVIECAARATDAASDDEAPFAPFAARLFLRTALQLPVLLRAWWRSAACPRRTADRAATFVTRFVGEIVIGHELGRVQQYVVDKKGGAGAAAPKAAATAGDDDSDSDSDDDDDDDEDDDDDSFQLRVFRQARQVVAQYDTDDIELAVTLTLPPTYPLDLIDVQSTTQFGVSENQWRRWVLSISSILMSQDGSLLDACLLWKDNLDKHFSGVEPCPICYSVLHLTNNQLPKMLCSNCKNKFHSACLFKWFSTSHKSACPLCSTPF
jgi:hypothetical protein